ncbi:MAG: response regulator transcription factor [Coriobacteriia bacterium]
MTVVQGCASQRNGRNSALPAVARKGTPSLWYLGIGPLWTLWLESGTIGTFWPSAVGGMAGLGRISSTLVYTLFAVQWLIVAIAGNRLSRVHERRPIMIAAVILSSLGLLLSYLVQHGLADTRLMFPAVGAVGIALVPLFLAWGELYGTIGTRLTSVSMSGGLLIHVGLYWVITYLSHSPIPYAAPVLLLVLPAASYIAVRKSFNQTTTEPRERTASPRARMPVMIISLAVGYGASLGLMLGLSVPVTRSALAANLTQALSVGLVALALFLYGILSTRWSLSRSYWPILPLTVLGFLLLPLVQGEHRYIALDFAMAGWAYCRVLMVAIYAEIVHRLEIPASTVFGWGCFANDSGVVLGLLAQGSLIQAPVIQPYLSVISVVAVLLLVCGSSLVLRERTVETLWGLIENQTVPLSRRGKGQGADRQQCATLIVSGKLTEREIEIFNLLAAGRNTDYIRRTLGLSPNTVRSHTARIYSKLGVHSHQDLIDLVERDMEVSAAASAPHGGGVR